MTSVKNKNNIVQKIDAEFSRNMMFLYNNSNQFLVSVFNTSLGIWQTLMHKKACLIPILFGYDDYNIENNIVLFRAVYSYKHATKCFNDICLLKLILKHIITRKCLFINYFCSQTKRVP